MGTVTAAAAAAAATEKSVGNDWRIYVIDMTSKKAIGGEVSGTLTINANPIDMSDKDSIWSNILTGSKNWSIGGEFLKDSTANSEQSKLLNKMITDQSTEVGIGIIRMDKASKVQEGFSGKALITSVEQSFGKDEASKLNVSFEGNGELSIMEKEV